MTQPTLASLLIQQTKAAIYEAALAIAVGVGLPVSSWQAGDPTRSLYYVEAEMLEALEALATGFISSGFLDYAHGMWLKICAKQGFNVDVPGATFATTTVRLTNTGGGVYDVDPGDLTAKSTITDKTYQNTTGGHLNGLGTLDLVFVADEAGSDSSAGAGEIDQLVTGLLGVTCSNALAAIGVDEWDETTTITQCRDKLGSLSPNGPKEVYSYVARNAELAGTSAVTRVRVYSDSDTGDVTVYLAGPGGGVSEPDRVLVEAAFARWATPLCTTVTTLAATNVVVPVTYELWIYKSCNKTQLEVQATVLAALEQMFASPTRNPIGGDIIPPATTGAMYLSLIESTIHATFPGQIFRVVVYVPATDTAITNGQVATLGTVIGVANLVVDP